MPKYPLKPLLEHRERRVDDATAELGRAIAERATAEGVLDDANAARRTAEARAQAIRSAEVERLERGQLCVVDLARGEAWEIAARAEAKQLDQVVQGAETDLGSRREAETAARSDLSQKMADRNVVRKDEERFDARLRKVAAAVEEEAAEEVSRGGRSHHGGGRQA
jgi:hypothetical protein